MKPDGGHRNALGNLPLKLMSDDGLMSAPGAQPKNLKPTCRRRNLRGNDRRNGNARGTNNQTPIKKRDSNGVGYRRQPPCNSQDGNQRTPTENLHTPEKTLPADRWHPGSVNRTDTETHVGREASVAISEAPTAAPKAHVATQMTIPDTATIHDKTARPSTGHHTLTGGMTGRTVETGLTNDRHLAIGEAITTEAPTRGDMPATLFSTGSGTIATPAGPGREEPPHPRARKQQRADQIRKDNHRREGQLNQNEHS